MNANECEYLHMDQDFIKTSSRLHQVEMLFMLKLNSLNAAILVQVQRYHEILDVTMLGFLQHSSPATLESLTLASTTAVYELIRLHV